MTFEQIAKANETIKTMDIKGKEYALVHQRIKAFRMCYPEGFILTHMVSNEEGVCVFVAEVGYYGADGETRVIGTGTAYERETSSYINKTSYIENCETSAVGRALGLAGFGIDTSVASAEEVENAIKQQEAAKQKDEPVLICTDCGNGIVDAPGKDGKTVTAKRWAKYSSEHANDGKVRCRECYEKYWADIERKDAEFLAIERKMKNESKD